jgi:conjugative transfer signal peptidase TraF
MMRAIGIIALSTVTLAHIGQAMGIRPNISGSAPVGLWLDRPITTPLHRGMMIGVCPPPTVPLVKLFSMNGTLPYGPCPETNVALLLKPIRALPGDTVQITHENPAMVNGIALSNTIASDSLPAWPDGEYIVRPGEVWIFSSYSDKSFDSRYFGPVRIADIRGEAHPLFIMKGEMQ